MKDWNDVPEVDNQKPEPKWTTMAIPPKLKRRIEVVKKMLGLKSQHAVISLLLPYVEVATLKETKRREIENLEILESQYEKVVPVVGNLTVSGKVLRKIENTSESYFKQTED